MESRTQVNISCSFFSAVYQKQKPTYIINRPRDVTPIRDKPRTKLTPSKSYLSNSTVSQKQDIKNEVNKSRLDNLSKCSIMAKQDENEEELRKIILKKTRIRNQNKKAPSFLTRKSNQMEITKNTNFSTTFEKTFPFNQNNRQSQHFQIHQCSRMEDNKLSFQQINSMKKFASQNMDELHTPKMQTTYSKGENIKTLKQLTCKNVTSSGGMTSEQHISVVSSKNFVQQKGVTGFFHRHSKKFQLKKLGFTQ